MSTLIHVQPVTESCGVSADHTDSHTLPSSCLIPNTIPHGSHEQLAIPDPPWAHLEVEEHAVTAVDYGRGSVGPLHLHLVDLREEEGQEMADI